MSMLPKLLISVLLAFATPALSRPDEVNVRERCRQIIAGGYLRLYDDQQRLADAVKAADEQIAALDQQVKQAETQYAAAKQAAAAGSFELAAAVKRDELGAVAQSLASQAKNYHGQRAAAAANLARVSAAEAVLRKSIAAVFNVTRTQDRQDGGYPVEVAYKSPCPKYRYLCALPPADRDKLLAIKIEGETPEACQRYVSLSKAR